VNENGEWLAAKGQKKDPTWCIRGSAPRDGSDRSSERMPDREFVQADGFIARESSLVWGPSIGRSPLARSTGRSRWTCLEGSRYHVPASLLPLRRLWSYPCLPGQVWLIEYI
jgi:hypothetical protein